MSTTVHTVRSANVKIQVGEDTIRLACHSGALPASNIGKGRTKHWRILESDLLAWLDAECPTEREASCPHG